MPSKDEIQTFLEDYYPEDEVTVADGMEPAFVGVVKLSGGLLLAVYHQQRCVDTLVSRGMSQEEALEWFDFNVIGAYVGECTPLFIDGPIHWLEQPTEETK